MNMGTFVPSLQVAVIPNLKCYPDQEGTLRRLAMTCKGCVSICMPDSMKNESESFKKNEEVEGRKKEVKK